MLSRKSIVIGTLCVLMVFAGYPSLIFGIGERCLSLDSIGCLKIGERCLMYVKITIDEEYRMNNDVPIIVVKDHDSGAVVVNEEMAYIGPVEDCNEYDSNSEVPSGKAYDVAIYINDISGDPILTSPVILCP